MGKSINGKELGKGISQRKRDGLYQGRFVNRFGKRETIYEKSLSELRHRLRNAQYEDENQINVVTKDITLDEWYDVWMDTCKRNCRNSTKATYATQYRMIKKSLGWRKLNSLNLVIVQQAVNELKTDNQRKNVKKLLVDMLDKAIDSDLLTRNVAKKVNTVISKEETKERRVLTVKETKIFLKEAEGTFYYNLYVLALETGMRIGELLGLTWKDVDFEKRLIQVSQTLCYFKKDGKYVFEMHETKTNNGKRVIPLTKRAIKVLKNQWDCKNKIIAQGKTAPEEYQDLIFVTRNNKPTQQFIVQECISAIIRHIQDRYPDFERFSSHCFRYTFATRAIENGMNPKTLQKLLGHGSLQMTMDLYCHVTDDTLFEAMKMMEKVV